MIHLTIEEMYLMKLLDCSGRSAALHDLALNMKLIQDKELRNQYCRLEDKLHAMSDEEFRSIDPKLYEEEQQR